MKKLLFVVLVLSLFLAVPVTAYNLVEENDYGIGAPYNTVSNFYWNESSIKNATMLKINTVGQKQSGLQSYSDQYCRITKMIAGYPQVGDVQVSLTSSEINETFSNYELTVKLYNYTGVGNAGGFALDWCNGLNRHWYSMDGSNTASWARSLSDCNPSDPNHFCVSDGTNKMGGVLGVYNGTPIVAPVASFSCVPTSQFPNTDVVCTDSSTGTSPDYLWSIDAEALGIKGWQTSNSRNFTWQSAYAGLYSVNLRVNNSAGSDWENKTNYVSISANATPNNCNLPKAAGYSRTVFECLNSQDSSAVAGCDIQLRDNEAGAWSNATNRQDGLWCIDTLPSHTINGYAQATGYTSTSSLNLHALDVSQGMYYLLLIPGYIPAAPDGKVYLYVTVHDYDNSQMIPSAYVTASWSGGGYTAATTSAAGTAILTVKNSTSIYITATKSGYVSVNKVITTTPLGPDSTTIGLHRMVVTPTVTATTGPGGTVPTTAGPWGTPGPGGTMPSGYTGNQGQIMMDYLAANGLSLVELCFLVTILALLGVKLGK